MRKFITVLAGVSMMVCACANKTDGSIPEWPWIDPDADNQAWIEVTSEYGKLPEYIKVYHSPEVLNGAKAMAYIATVDLSKASFNVWGIDDPGCAGTTEEFRTPTDVYNEMDAALVINGGYFYSSDGLNYPASLAVNNGKIYSYNINYASLDWETMYYPTRAAFIEHASGKIEAAWTYQNGSDHYLYQSPAGNGFGNKPLPTPSATYPVTAETFEAKTAIGAGPVLVKGGEIINSYRFECFQGDADTNCANPDPRTAIGVTADNRLVLFVCEGREMTEGVKGYSTENVAKLMKEFGCVEAINLDGGGSSCMLVNGMETIKPSDGAQRKVGSVVYVK